MSDYVNFDEENQVFEGGSSSFAQNEEEIQKRIEGITQEALTRTNQGVKTFIKIEEVGEKEDIEYVVSNESPIGQFCKDKKAGEVFKFRDNNYRIRSLTC